MSKQTFELEIFPTAKVNSSRFHELLAMSPKKRYLEGQIVQNMRGSHLQVRPLPDDLNKPSCGKSPGITWTKLALELPGSQQRHRYLGTLKKHSLGNPNNPVTPL